MDTITLFSNLASIIGCESNDYLAVRRTTDGKQGLTILHGLHNKFLYQVSNTLMLGKEREKIRVLIRDLLSKVLERIIKKENQEETELKIVLSPDRVFGSSPEELSKLEEKLKKRLNGYYRPKMTYSWNEISVKIRSMPFLIEDEEIKSCLDVVDKAHGKMQVKSAEHPKILAPYLNANDLAERVPGLA